ncbi:MAG: flagellar hook-basal body complex protein FliE [Alcaligenaceae bacterium]|uniref:Flagellar hook-basal body complex protein FliE n=1 Tax=Oligella ureolytica TaxID=90244 RepID=A0A378XGK8_9BURK|nr:flagellar hook-basal body complex protein FliE [Oligella ureolytica]NLY64830.1 flagellar hook-basal body complex protein FliE [Alcaligenaceae bacterium]QPT39129.1 flagellar hook-basal body complex protein FliE [Oligella ureolytica]SUA54889.1 Flagellar hook-basal body complex protein FliE [Oligella ureolytica]SUA56121.1 Flagellar hook-basal body complex protein FliE [Oligella ureolytica]
MQPLSPLTHSGIAGLQQQMQALTEGARAGRMLTPLSMGQVASASQAQAASGDAPSFASALSAAMKDIAATQKAATYKSEQFMAGQPGISLNDVMIDMQKASIGFQTAIQVRNKLVQAYQTIASMPI